MTDRRTPRRSGSMQRLAACIDRQQEATDCLRAHTAAAKRRRLELDAQLDRDIARLKAGLGLS